MLFTLLFFYVFFDANSRVTNVIEFIWGEAYRAILVGDQTQQTFKVDFLDLDRSEVSATVTLTESYGAPLSEVLGHWLAGESPTILDKSGHGIEIASVKFSLPMRILDREVLIFISKEGANDFSDDMLTLDAIDLSKLAVLQDARETDWPLSWTTYFDQNCKADLYWKRSFITTDVSEYNHPLSTEDESLEDASTEEKHVVSIRKVDLFMTMVTDRFGPIPRMSLTRKYRLTYNARLSYNELYGTYISCMQFVPELQWINRTDYVSRGKWGLDTLGPLAIYWTDDGTPKRSDLDRLIERVQSPSASVPAVSESFPIRFFFMAAPWVSIFLSLILSRRIRALGRELPVISRIAFFGEQSQPKIKLSFLDGPFLIFFERISCLIPALIASIAPVAVSIASHIPNGDGGSVSNLATIYDFIDVKVLPYFIGSIAASISHETRSLIQVFFGFILGMHILCVIFLAMRKR